MKVPEVPVKYLIEFKFEVGGIVEESDIIGAIFGQTEGLLGPTFDLRELQKAGKIGRIIVKTTNREGKTYGKIIVASALDIPSTSLLIALIESVTQVGPYEAKISLTRLIDYRKSKIEKIINRAKQIIDSWKVEVIPKAEEIIEELRQHLAPPPTITIGKERIPAGPDALKSNEVILVEGRADVANLLKYGIRNVIAIEGAKIPETLREILKGKTIIAFLDGDRGGELNLKKLLQTIKIDYVAWAPKGKEVEDLKPEEIFNALKNKISISSVVTTLHEELGKYEKYINEVNGRLDAVLLDKNDNIIEKIPVSELVERLKEIDEGKVNKIVFDGIVTERLLDIASKKGVALIIGNRMGEVKGKYNIRILCFGQRRNENRESQ